ncbi:MAG: DUF4347 domain-containing protein, partial [Bacteroidetes bacterium]|nr:DUF4347 domain-containing protein [Bacteroidota bacterium]
NGQWRNAQQIADWYTEQQLNNSTAQQLNIYGCNFAKGEKGKQAVSFLEATLGVSIAASDDITGKDGDWELEIGNAQNALALNHYANSLQDNDGDGVLDINDLDDDNDGVLDFVEQSCEVAASGDFSSANALLLTIFLFPFPKFQIFGLRKVSYLSTKKMLTNEF